MTAVFTSCDKLNEWEGMNDDKVIEACNACYENLKQRLNGRSGMVVIIKTRHPDGKSKMLTAYAFQ